MVNDETEVDFASMSGKFCVPVEKYLFLNPLIFHILAMRVLGVTGVGLRIVIKKLTVCKEF